LRQCIELIERPGLRIVDHAADLELVVLSVDLGRFVLRVIGIERKRPPHRAVRVGRRELVRIEQPCLRSIVETGNLHQYLFRRRPVDNVAAGEKSQCAEARAAA
jgi:hypothetical protein